MKGYVIKTGNGEYFSGFDTESGFGTTKDIENAVIYSAKRYKKQELEEDVPEFENCKVVEVTLSEGDLEKIIDNLGEIASGANKAYIETFHREQTYKKALLKMAEDFCNTQTGDIEPSTLLTEKYIKQARENL